MPVYSTLKGNEDSPSEAYDFVVEHINKKIKSNLSWAPTKKLWLTATRAFNFTESLLRNVNKWFSFSRQVNATKKLWYVLTKLVFSQYNDGIFGLIF